MLARSLPRSASRHGTWYPIAPPSRPRETRTGRRSRSQLLPCASQSRLIAVAAGRFPRSPPSPEFSAEWSLRRTSSITEFARLDAVRLQERVARARFLTTMPTATVSVIRVYSTRVARGRVVRRAAAGTSQPPSKRSERHPHDQQRLAVCRSARDFRGRSPAETAKGRLKRNGFRVRYRFTPSWSVGKGTR